MSPQGTVREQAGVTQNTAGVSDTAQEADRFGEDVVVASANATSVIATPQTLAWAVAASNELASPSAGVVHAFRPGWRAG